MHPTLLSFYVARADSRTLRVAQRAGAVAFVTVLTAIAAQISIPLPFTPVPFTFQPMVVLLGAALLGSRLGSTSQVLYLALGAKGWLMPRWRKEDDSFELLATPAQINAAARRMQLEEHELLDELKRREGISGVAEKAARARNLPVAFGLETTKIP